MRSILPAFLVSFLAVLSTAAQPQITSVTPDNGPAKGGTTVTIKGSGFSMCVICSPATPPFVTFGMIPAAATTLVDSNTLLITMPAMLPMTVDVNVAQHDGTATLANAFTFTGPSGYEPVILPIFSPPIHGAFGSEFVTTVTAANRSSDGPVAFLGLDTSCFLFSPVLGPMNQRLVETGVGKVFDVPAACNYDWPARVMYVRWTDTAKAAFNIRVHDTSRNASSHGTEIPAVHAADLTSAPIVLPGVPADDRFRAMLRVYSLARYPVEVSVVINGEFSQLTLFPGPTMFDPAYATFTDFPKLSELPTGRDTFTVVVYPPQSPGGISPPIPMPPVWAFITVTNNQTQEITTITPDL